ncbi:hypothetical protein KP509_34G067100 [Ceratopteris richardii]|uniref:Uncharacterized protein n=1 Tax=Ceratopteris richardii TaxID=49495 RepID=A0A8T2QKY7_CERRI|nr:hypothetical protein KP509_34G067100 [Ceratopteris richardii]
MELSPRRSTRLLERLLMVALVVALLMIYPAEPASVQVRRRALSVRGLVVCQSCNQVGTDSLAGAKPLNGAQLRLLCKDEASKTSVNVTTRSLKNGSFLFKIPNFFDPKKADPKPICKVFLISSPAPSCKQQTDINSGQSGGALLRPARSTPKTILYSVGPFAFAPDSRCWQVDPTSLALPPSSANTPEPNHP